MGRRGQETSNPESKWGSLEEKYRLMCMQVLNHRFKYYVLAKTEISDQEYDVLESDLKKFEQENPDLVHPNTPTKSVGSSEWNTYPRSIRMLHEYEYLNPPFVEEKQIPKKDKKKIVTIWD